jgi:hypothetical protein
MATFIDCVNRVLRINNVIRGDDDAITAFSDTQHSADIQTAQIAIQAELTELISDRLIPYEKTSGTITLVTGTRTYALANGFTRFFGIASFLDSTNNVRLFEYPGGEAALMNHDYQYKTTQASPWAWYWANATSKQVAFYNVPDSTYNNRSLAYEYETSVMVSDTTDTMPFHNNEEYFSFSDMAARRFKYLVTNKDTGELQEDPTYKNAKSRLYALLRPTNPNSFYGNQYC